MSQSAARIAPASISLASCDGRPRPARRSEAKDQAGDQRRIQVDLLQCASDWGFQGAFYVHLGHAIPTAQGGWGLVPIRFAASVSGARLWYLGEEGEVIDPAGQRAREGGMPFFWTTAEHSGQAPGEREFRQRLRRRGVISGLCVPVADYVAGPAYLSFYCAYEIGAGDPKMRGGVPALAFAAQQLHVTLKATLNATVSKETSGSLTPREITCLRLGALGRTVAESAAALNVTPRTIEFHLKNAAEKFGAPNKLRTILMAVNAGLIEV